MNSEPLHNISLHTYLTTTIQLSASMYLTILDSTQS